MKTTMIKFFAVLIVIGTFGFVSFAQNAKRIDFAKEGCCLVWEEKVAANSSKSFVFYARKGQKLRISFTDDTKVGSMDLGKFSIEPNADPLEMVIELTKDYTLSVSNNSNKATSFRIAVSLEDAKSSSNTSSANSNDSNLPNTERVKFPQGSIEVNLERTVAANNARRFVFNAKAGQEIAFTVTPARKNATLNIEFNGKEVRPGELFTLKAPKTGDYLIQVVNVDDKAQAFTLDLGIAAADRTGDSANPSSNTSSDNLGGERVRFAKGETSTTLTREIPANGSIDFIITANKGQTMGFTVGYDFKDSDIQAFLTEPGLQDISLSSGPKKPNEFVIKKTGDHRLTVNNMTRKKITMTLYLNLN
jgi:hypothetical protein